MRMRKGAILLSIGLLFAVGFGYWHFSSVPNPDVVQNDERIARPPAGATIGRLAVQGIGPSKPVRLGQPVSVQFRLMNPGPGTVWILGSLDGSASGRSPVCRLEILDSDGREQFPEPPRRCGNHNELEQRDFTELPAGRTHTQELETYLAWWKPTRPGIYSITLTYDTSCPYVRAWAGDATTLDRRVRELLSLVPRGTFQSNKVMVTITP